MAKTMRMWFEEYATVQDYESLRKQLPADLFLKEPNTLIGAFNMFRWQETNEGYDYWQMRFDQSLNKVDHIDPFYKAKGYIAGHDTSNCVSSGVNNTVIGEKPLEKRKIIGYKAPYDLFQGRIKKDNIFSIPSSYNLVMYTPSHMTRGVATEIVQTWEPVYEEPNIVLVVGVPSIKVTIGKDGTIKAEGEQIPWGPIERLKNEMRSKNFFVGVAWDVTYPFVKIGCSTFSREDIVKIWETFAKLNNKNK